MFFQFPCVLQINCFLLYIVKKITMMIIYMFNIRQPYSIPAFLRASFQDVNYNEREFITMKQKKKEMLDSSITFPARYYSKYINIFTEKLTNRSLLLQYEVENFIFSLTYGQPKFYQNTSEKLLIFITIRHRKFHLFVQLFYTKILYLCENRHMRKYAYYIFV